MVKILIDVFLFCVPSVCYGAPTTDLVSSDAVCTSCTKLVDFTKKLVGNESRYEETKRNLIQWCIDTGKGGNVKVVSILCASSIRCKGKNLTTVSFLLSACYVGKYCGKTRYLRLAKGQDVLLQPPV